MFKSEAILSTIMCIEIYETKELGSALTFLTRYSMKGDEFLNHMHQWQQDMSISHYAESKLQSMKCKHTIFWDIRLKFPLILRVWGNFVAPSRTFVMPCSVTLLRCYTKCLLLETEPITFCSWDQVVHSHLSTSVV